MNLQRKHIETTVELKPEIKFKNLKEKKIMDKENRLVVAKGERKGVGWTGNWGLIDANYCLWNG